eukprot:GDKK01049327.1.p2 GENE.GDKK01049327.1~~GDKK01049327.1.p2  ORF type:complete len:102 (+),score=10.40 GDKK01049327.1:264-569(+)
MHSINRLALTWLNLWLGSYTSRVHVVKLGGPAKFFIFGFNNGNVTANLPSGWPVTTDRGVIMFGCAPAAMPAANSDCGVPSLVNAVLNIFNATSTLPLVAR